MSWLVWLARLEMESGFALSHISVADFVSCGAEERLGLMALEIGEDETSRAGGNRLNGSSAAKVMQNLRQGLASCLACCAFTFLFLGEGVAHTRQHAAAKAHSEMDREVGGWINTSAICRWMKESRQAVCGA